MNRRQHTRIAPGWMVLLILTGAALAILPSVRAESQAVVPREVSLPSWNPLPSPDGQYVIYNADEGALTIRLLSGGEARRLVSSADTGRPGGFLWSKDSKRVFYTWCHKLATQPNCNQSLEFDLRVIGVDGTGGRVIFPRSKGGIWPLDTSADGQHVLALLRERPSTGTSQLALISVRDGTVRELKTTDNDTMRYLNFSRAGALSYDGRYVVYTRLPRYGPGDIFLLSTDGSGVEHALIDDAADDRFVGWTPDGRSILFTSDRAGTTDLWSAAVTNGRVADLPVVMMRAIGDNETSELEGLSITSTGSLYYSKWYALHYDVQVVSLDPGKVGVLSQPRSITTSHTGDNLKPQWSPDGSRIAYRSTSETRGASPRIDSITILSVDSWSERQIQPRLNTQVSNWDFNWAPDGRSFLVSVTGAPASARGLYKVDAQTGETTTLLTRRGPGGTSPYVTQAAWLPDGRSIVFVEAFRSVVIRSMVTAEERSVYSGSVLSMELSPDGHQLAAAVRGQDQDRNTITLTVVDVRDKLARSLGKFHESGWSPTLTWSADGRFILYFDRAGPNSSWELWRVPAAGGMPEKPGLTVAGAAHEFQHVVTNPSMRRDGRRLAFTLLRRQRLKTDYVLENLLPGDPRPRDPVEPQVIESQVNK